MERSSNEEAFLLGLVGPKHWSEGAARRALALEASSGLSRIEFARRHGLRATRLAWWSRRIAQWDDSHASVGATREAERDDTENESTIRLDAAPKPSFIEMIARTQDASPERTRLGAIVHMQGGVRVQLGMLDEEAAKFIASLVRAMSEGPCS